MSATLEQPTVNWDDFEPVTDVDVQSSNINWSDFEPAVTPEHPTQFIVGSQTPISIIPDQPARTPEELTQREFLTRADRGVPVYQSPPPSQALADTVVPDFFNALTAEHKPTDTIPSAIAKGVYNVGLGLPRFATSPIGVASLVAGTAAPRLVTAAFAGDMLQSSIKSFKDLGEQWEKLSPSQRAGTLTELVLGTAMGLGLAKKTVTGFQKHPLGWNNETQRKSVEFLTELAQKQPDKFTGMVKDAITKTVDITQRTPEGVPIVTPESRQPEKAPVVSPVEPSAPSAVAEQLAAAAEKPAAAGEAVATKVSETMEAGRAAPEVASAEAQTRAQGAIAQADRVIEEASSTLPAATQAAGGVKQPTAPEVAPKPSVETPQPIVEAAKPAIEQPTIGEPNASEISTPTTVHGDVRPLEESTSKLPVQEGSTGVQPKTEAGLQETRPSQGDVLLTPEQPVGMGGATPAEFAKAGEPPIASKFRLIDEAREKRGLKPVLKSESKTDQQVLNRALEAYDKDPVGAHKLADDIINNPRPLEDWENHYVLLRWIDVRDQFYRDVKRAEQAQSEGRLADLEIINKQLQDWESAMSTYETALRESGSEAGRALRARQVLISEDFSLEGLIARKRAARGGEPITPEERMDLKRIADEFQTKLDELNKQLADRDAKIRELESRKAIVEVGNSAPKTPTTPKQREASIASITEKIRNKIEKDESSNITPYVKKLAEQFWMQGIRKHDPMIDALQNVLKDFLPDITRQETMDALSGRGRFTLPNQLPVKKGIRDLSHQARLIAHQIDVENRRPLPRTGPQRDPMSPEARREQQRLNELKRKFGVVVQDPQAQLASALSQAKTYVRNRMADLRQEIDTRERIVKTKTPLQPDAELEAMRIEYDALKKEHAAMFPRQELTPEQRNEIAIRSLDRAIAGMERDIDAGILYPEKKVKPLLPNDPIRLEKEAWLAALKEQRQELRDLANPKLTPEQRALQAHKTRITKRLAELRQRIAEGNYEKKPRKEPPVYDKETAELAAELEKVKMDFARGVENDRLAKRQLWEKARDLGGQALNVPRNMLSSWDLSAVLRQGGFLTLSHPIRAARSIKPMMEALVSEKAAARIEQQILNRPNAKSGLYKRSKLYIAPQEAFKLSVQEEQLMSRLTPAVDKLYKVTGVKASNRAYLTFLNKLRADSFDAMVNSLKSEGKPLTLEEHKAIAHFINVATGRGGDAVLAFPPAANFLATMFFSPRLTLSRFQMLYSMFGGHQFMPTSKRVRMQVMKDYLKFGGFLATVFGLANLAGADVELDTRSSDFGKIVIGNTRIDAMSGLSQAITLLARVSSVTQKNREGDIVPLSGPDRPYNSMTWGKVWSDFFAKKLSPWISSGKSLLTGEDYQGKPITPTQVALQSVTPLSWQEIKKLADDVGVPMAAAIQMLNLLGAASKTYDE